MSESRSGASEGGTGRPIAMNKLIYFFGSLGAILWGYDTGVIGSALLFIKEDLALSPFMQGLVVSGLPIGAVIGAAGGPFADGLGRRRIIILAAFVFGLGGIGTALAVNAAMLVAFRIVMGMGVGISSVVVPLYLSEMAPTEIRGALATLNNLMIVIGILIAYVVDYALAANEVWRWMLGLSLVPSVILLIGMYFMPETPRWLVKQNREEDAREVLRQARAKHNIEDELGEIKRIASEEEQTSLRDLLAPWVRPALVVAIGLSVFQQFLGINTIIYYAPTILTDVGFGNLAAILANVGIGVLNVIMIVIAMVIVDRVGRKPLLMWGLVGMVLSLVVLGVASMLLPEPSGVDTVSIVTLACLAGFVASFQIGWGPVLWVMLPEVLPRRIRGSAIGVANVLHFIANVIVSLSFPVLLAAIGIGPLFLGYAVIGILAYLFVGSQVTETKGRSLEQIEIDLRERSLIT